MIPAKFQKGRNIFSNKIVQPPPELDAKEIYVHTKNRPFSFRKRGKCSVFISSVHTMPFSNVLVRVPLSKSTVFKICRHKKGSFSCEREAYPSHFHRF